MFVTNFDIANLKHYKSAISEYKAKTGCDRLSIRNDAYDSYGHKIFNCMSLHDNEHGDLSAFWKFYYNIKNYHVIKYSESDVKTAVTEGISMWMKLPEQSDTQLIEEIVKCLRINTD